MLGWELISGLVSAVATSFAAWFTFRAAQSSRESAAASMETARIARETIELSRQADVIVTVGNSTIAVTWEIEPAAQGSLPILNLDGARAELLSVVNVGAGHAFDVRLNVESIQADPDESSRTDYGGGTGTDSEVFVHYDGNKMSRGWFHSAATAAVDEAARTASLATTGAFGSAKLIEGLILSDILLRDIAYGALQQFRNPDPEREVQSIKRKIFRRLKVTGSFRSVDGQKRELPATMFAFKVIGIEIYGSDGRPIVSDQITHRYDIRPPRMPTRWHRAAIKMSVEHEHSFAE